MAKSLNRVQLIGNLTRDPELRYTPSGSAVCSFGIATNRSWTTDTGEKRDEVDFHNIVAWRKLAEICSQFLTKGRKVFVEGRLSTSSWTAQDGTQKSRTEVVIDDMILLDSKPGTGAHSVQGESPVHAEPQEAVPEKVKPVARKKEAASDEGSSEPKAASAYSSGEPKEEVAPDDIPF
jgi:single-strand DNA-binding protein